MNCRRIEELIPLYVEDDLDSGRKEEMRAHLSSCERCNGLSLQYRESQQWLRSYAAPAFDADFFDGLKRSVLADIERSRMRPTFFQLIARGWRWNAALATAVALLITGAVALYVYQSRAGENRAGDEILAHDPQGNDEQPAIVEKPEKLAVAPQPQPLERREGRSLRAAIARKRSKDIQLPQIEPELISEIIEPENAAEINDADPVVEQALHSELIEPINELEGEFQISEPPAPPPGLVRIEIQTSDPSIRIIWFAPKDAGARPGRSTIANETEALCF